MKKACSKGSLIWLTLDKIKSKYSEINCGISNGVNTEFGDAFRQLAPIPTLSMPTEYLQKNKVVLNWYPKIQVIKSKSMIGGDEDAAPHITHFQPKHIAFLDIANLYFNLERYKAERGWYNINITREAIKQLLSDQSWYQLCIPATSAL